MSFQIPGDVVDLQGFLLGEMDHSVATLTATKVGVIPHNLLLQTTERYPFIARALWQSTLINLAVSGNGWWASVGGRPTNGSPTSSARCFFACKLWGLQMTVATNSRSPKLNLVIPSVLVPCM